MLAFQWQRYWSHWWGWKDTTGHDDFNPSSLHSRDCKLTTQGVQNGCLSPCIDFWSDHFILNTNAGKLLAFPMQGTPCHCYLLKGEEPCSTSYLGTLAKTSGRGLALATLPHVSVELSKPLGVSNAWHKEQNSVLMYKHWRTFIKCFSFDIFINS